MANLIAGIDWIDHAMIPKRELTEKSEEPEDTDEEGEAKKRPPLDERCW